MTDAWRRLLFILSGPGHHGNNSLPRFRGQTHLKKRKNFNAKTPRRKEDVEPATPSHQTMSVRQRAIYSFFRCVFEPLRLCVEFLFRNQPQRPGTFVREDQPLCSIVAGLILQP
jgi:hypothetical protein